MKNFLTQQAGFLLLLITTLFTGCTDTYDPPDANLNSLEDDVYILYYGSKDADNSHKKFVWHKGEILSESPDVLEDKVSKIYVENGIKYFSSWDREFNSFYYIEDERIEIPNPNSHNEINGFEVFNGKMYAFGYSETFQNQNHQGYWIDGIPHELNLEESIYPRGSISLTTDGTDIYILVINKYYIYSVYKNGEMLYTSKPGERFNDITYTNGHLYACGIKDGKGAIWIDGELWKTDTSPVTFGSEYTQIKIKDGHVFTIGEILDESESGILTLFRDGTQLIRFQKYYRHINDFEIGNDDTAYLIFSGDTGITKVNNITQASGITAVDYYFPSNKGYHVVYPFSVSINHVR